MNSTQESIKVVSANLEGQKANVAALERELATEVAKLPQNTVVRGGGPDIALMLRSCTVTGPGGTRIDAEEKSIVCLDRSKVLELRGLNPEAPGVYCIKTEEMIHLLESEFAKATDNA